VQRLQFVPPWLTHKQTHNRTALTVCALTSASWANEHQFHQDIIEQQLTINWLSLSNFNSALKPVVKIGELNMRNSFPLPSPSFSIRHLPSLDLLISYSEDSEETTSVTCVQRFAVFLSLSQNWKCQVITALVVQKYLNEAIFKTSLTPDTKCKWLMCHIVSSKLDDCNDNIRKFLK